MLLISLLLFTVPVCRAAEGGYRADFVLDAEDAVAQGAVLLATVNAQSREECERACVDLPPCNLALSEPHDACALFDCVYRNRFVCNRFQNRGGYQTFVTKKLYETFLQAPPTTGDQRRPIAVGGRDLVVQPGESVLLNGIESLSPGTIQQYIWNQQKGDQATVERTQYPDQVNVSGLVSGSYLFELRVTDSNGNSASDTVLVQVLSPEQSSLFCLAPPKVGPCRASFTRWRYDAVSGVCRNFTFGGCKGNYNNFLSAAACETACRGVQASLERSAPPPGSKECVSVCAPLQMLCDTNCCVHKSLECDGVQQCVDGTDERECGKVNQTFNRLLNIELDQKKARCSLPPHTGPCRASFSRWFYDPVRRQCQSFTFGGCDANGNNWEEEAQCEEACRGVTEEDVFAPGMFKRFEDEDESQSGSIALAVILTVTLLALLAIASYCFIRRKKSHQPVPTDQN
ncbi:unnamed protein product [Knipowitschia caucasica]|uniref:Uncharacterized protein n=1 Tax=Knipowitschia caucasica TaxID=637954 RepID=A0AAV2KC54_KNICA